MRFLVDMLVSGSIKKARISSIIMHEDSPTIAKIIKSVAHKVKKEIDIDHVKKALGNNLYVLQKKPSILSQAT